MGPRSVRRLWRMKYVTRIGLFLLTNLAVIVLLGVVSRLLGLDGALTRHGLDLRALLLFASIWGFAGSFISLALSKFMAKTGTGARVITRPGNEEEAWLVHTVGQLAQRAGIGMPEVAIFPSGSPNAFATGARRDHALVAVSEGLLRTMSRSEIEAVLAHEISHVANGDMVTLSLLQGVVNTFVIFLARVFGYFVDRAVLRNDRGRGIGYWIGTMLAEMVLGILASIIVMWFSRRREFRADAGAAGLVGPAPMIAALERLMQVRNPPNLPSSVSAFGIRGGPPRGLFHLLMSHPPLEQRIEALKEFRG